MDGLEAEKIQPKRICEYTKLYRIVFREKILFLLYKKAKDTEDRHQKYKTSQYSRGEKNGL